MEQSRIPKPYEHVKAARLQQGDIFLDITLFEGIQEEGRGVEVQERLFPYIIVLSQDCDLEQDFQSRANPSSGKHDKYLQSVLLCPGYQSERFKLGTHLESLSLTMETWGRDDMKKIRQNMNYRFHRLQAATPELQIPELVLDFKHCITAPRAVAYRPSFRANYLGTVAELYREDLSGRFAHFLSRIALPEQQVATEAP